MPRGGMVGAREMLRGIFDKTTRRQTVIAMEQDKYSPSLETAFKVAIVLGVTLEKCFQYDPEGKR